MRCYEAEDCFLAILLVLLAIAAVLLTSQPTTQYGGQFIPLTSETQFYQMLSEGFTTTVFPLTQTVPR